MIQINEKLRISTLDDKNLQIEVLTIVNKKKDGIKTGEQEKKWLWAGYYGDLKSALLGILKKQLFETVNEENQLKDIVRKIEDAETSIIKAIQDKRISV